jgi:2',3'-cyclic-nucleotide 2'-phosphodiesterase/3'-nucleotidase
VPLLLAALASPQPRRTTVTILATTDLHGNLLPLDYATNRPAARGLAAVATLIRQVRAENPRTILIDCGDTIQGSPLETVYQSGPHGSGDPMMRAMNLLGYDAMVLGNHEFTAGSAILERARRDARFPWISANTTGFDPAIVRTVEGIRIAIIGITTPAVPTLEPADRLGPHRFSDPVGAVRRELDALHPDLAIVAAHSGLGREAGEDPAEHVVSRLARDLPQLDAIVFGHSHKELPAQSLGNVLVIQPKFWGASLARLDFTFEGRHLVHKSATLIPVTPDTPADLAIMKLAQPYEAAAQKYLDTPVSKAARDYSGDAVADLINRVQLAESHADVSVANVFNPEAMIRKGPVTLREITAIYPYENDLLVIEGTAEMLRGLADRVAVTPGADPNRPLRIALNSYRATQPPFRGAKVLWKSPKPIRDLLAATPVF